MENENVAEKVVEKNIENATKKTTVEVVINGEIITMTGVESDEYIQRLARYIDRKISDIQKEKKIISFNTFIKALMLAINIADDLHKEIDKNDGVFEKYEEALLELGKLQEENIMFKEKLREMQTELTNAELELDGYAEVLNKEEKLKGQSNNKGQVYNFKKK